MIAPVVALCTDFGLADPYVGEMKAALYAQWSRYPELSARLPLEAVGEPGTVSDLGVFPEPALDDGVLGRVVWIDRFGNAVTDVAPESVGGRALILDGLVIDGPRRTYGDAPADAPFWYVGSGGTIEFALRDGHGARTFSWRVGMALRPSAP